MKKKNILLLVLTSLIIISVPISISLVNNSILSYNFKDESIDIFIPSGMADKYNDYMTMSFDDRRVWIYALNKNEIEQINEEIKNEPWREFTEASVKEAELYLSEGNWSDELSEEVYYCLYDLQSNQFIRFDSESSLLGWHRLLFLYDSVNHKYYCASMSV